MKKFVIILCLIFFCQICTAGITTNKIENKEIMRTQPLLDSVDSSFFNRIYISGHGTTFLLFPLMRSGLGFCFFIRVNLENDGYVEISRNNNQIDPVILNREQIINLIGFFGIFNNGGCNGNECHPMTIQGRTILTEW